MSLRIGVCDSGVGGLSVLKELYIHVPAEYVYIGDSLRAPCGNRSREELLVYTRDLLIFLKNKQVDIYVNACNSLSTLDVEHILQDLGIDKENYVDMRTYAAYAKDDIPQTAHMLIYGTSATLASGVYQDLFSLWSPMTLVSRGLAYAIETKHQIDIDEEVDLLVDYVLKHSVTHIFLACTHYPLIKEYLDTRLSGLSVTCINPAVYVPQPLRSCISGTVRSCTVYTTNMSAVWNTYMETYDDAHVTEISINTM